jgi:acyl-CoA dehydrogenase
MEEHQKIILESTNRLFADHVTPELLRQPIASSDCASLWQEISDAGLANVLCSEERGGTGGGWPDAYLIIKSAGAHAVPLPLADIIAGHWLAELGKFQLPNDLVPLWAPAKTTGGEVELSSLPEFSLATHVIGWDDTSKKLMAFELADVDVERGENIAGEGVNLGRATTASARMAVSVPNELANMSALGLGALLRVGLMAGALEAALGLSVEYANDRVQFGRPIGKFQAVQQQLAMMSGYVAMANRAAIAAFKDPGGPFGFFDIACAKSIAGEAAGIASSTSHQVHGAMGITREYHLQFLTRRLWAWRAEFGSETFWSDKIGAAVLDNGADALWPKITANTLALTTP